MNWLSRSLFSPHQRSRGNPPTPQAEVVAEPPPQVMHPCLIRLGGIPERQKSLPRNLMRRQELGGRMPGVGYRSTAEAVYTLRDDLDRRYDGLPNDIIMLQRAIDGYISAREEGGRDGSVRVEAEWKAICELVGDIIAQRLLHDTNTIPEEQMHNMAAGGGRTWDKRVRRDHEAFVAFAGHETLLRILQPPFFPRDARQLIPSVANTVSEVRRT